MSVFYRASTLLMKFLLLLFTRWKVEGKERVPREGPLIIVANHLHLVDPPLLSASIPRRIIFMAKEELFHFWGTPIIKAFGAFPVKRGKANREAFAKAFAILNKGQVLGMFPEGRRSRSGGLEAGFLGSAFIALRSKAPILPVGIIGTDKLKRKDWLWRRPKITVNVGEVFSFADQETKLSKRSLKKATDIIMRRIAELLPEEYRGVYKEAKIED